MVRMWWPTGNSQLKVFGMNHRIMDLPTIVQEGRKQARECFLPFGGSGRGGKKSKEVDFCLCGVRGFFTFVLADSYISART